MRVSIKDMASLQGIDPAFVETYLASKGWERVTNIPNKASIWAIGKDDPIQITLPTNRNFRDFPTRIGEVLQAIESVENRSQLFILTDLLNVNSDVVRIRIDTLKTTNNNLPIEDGFAVIQGAQNLLGATARAVVKPSPYFAGGKPAEVSTFLKNSLLGQTEPGSFVVTIIAPIKKTIEDPVQMSYLDVSDPFERRVTEMLARALESLRVAAQNLQGKQVNLDKTFLETIVNEGISANFCEGILNIIHVIDETEELTTGVIEFNFQWSPALDTPDSVPTSVVFGSEIAPPIQQIREALQEIEPQEFVIEGIVITLSRRDDGAGKVSIVNLNSEGPSVVSVELRKDWYEKAIDAHRTRQRVSVSGTLIQKGKSAKILDPQDFELI